MHSVFVVDPDAAIRDGLENLLDSFSIKAHTYANAQSFLHDAAATAAGCVLIENDLPDLCGLEVLKRLRQHGNSLPVLLLTSSNDTGLVKQALHQGAFGVLHKPLASERLIEQLQTVLNPMPAGTGAAQVQYELLADGTPLTIRAILPTDAAIEQDFVRALSLHAKHLRFFTAMQGLPPALLEDFSHVHYPDKWAVIATAEEDGHDIEIGVARYGINADEEDYNGAEFADGAEFVVVVKDEWHGRGVATLLLTRLTESARAAGLKCLYGHVLRENHHMLALLHKLGFEVQRYPNDSSLVRVHKSLETVPKYFNQGVLTHV